MKIILDTHTIIWVIEDNSSLSTKHSTLISDTKNEKFVSEFSDPFDRLIISTAIFEDISILTVDDKFKFYSKLVDII